MGALKPVKAGLVGCGQIATAAYMPTIMKLFGMVDVVKFADVVDGRAQVMAKNFNGTACTYSEMLNDPEIEIIINLTFPNFHYEVTKAAIMSGKHVYCEKMMASNLQEARELAALAEEKGVWYTQAPDTFLGGAWQTARKLLDDGYIGTPVSAHCFVPRGGFVLGADRGTSTRRPLSGGGDGNPFASAAPKRFEPLVGSNPRSVKGSGLPYDMGGYYLHNLINMLGSINRVSGFCAQQKGVISRDPLNSHYNVDFPADRDEENVAGVLEFDCGAYCTLLFSAGVGTNFDHSFVIYGTQGTLVLPDPNFCGGVIKLQTNAGLPFNMLENNGPAYSRLGGPPAEMQWPVPFTHGYLEECRGIGVCDMAFAIRNGRKPRCHYSMGLQAFEAIQGIVESNAHNIVYKMQSHCERPLAVKPGIYSGEAQQFALDD